MFRGIDGVYGRPARVLGWNFGCPLGDSLAVADGPRVAMLKVGRIANMATIDEIVEDLRTKRDEIEVKLHLASKDLQRDFEDLEEKWEAFRGKAGIDRTAKGVASALDLLGDELKQGYERIKKAL